ncbi:MAG: prolipoprotein diacylglyceryl transferase [Actinobacteria bacterium]|nr:prolipoprotein diacylglyceryl transferase [Actinomycetota bacterium]
MNINPVAFNLFGKIEIRWYGILIAAGLVIGIVLAYYIAKYRKLKADEIINFAPFAIIGGIICARLLHVVVNWSFYAKYPSYILAYRQGGLAIQGAVIGGIIALIIFTRVRKIDFWAYADSIIPALAIAQAIGRWGNFFNQEAFGRPTSSKLGIFIAPENRPPDYMNAEYFHPTFLYESMANLILFGILIFMHYWFKKRPNKYPNGLILNAYLIIYSLYRIFIESYRIDSSYVGQIKVVYLICGFTIIVALVIANILINKFNAKKKEQALIDEEKEEK